MSTATSFPTLRSQIAGMAVTELADRFGTPCYVYDWSIIARRIADLQLFDGVRYAQKALSNIAILDRMRRHGVVVDAVSAGEIERALAAGFRPDTHPAGIVYTADVFDQAALDLVVQHNIPVNCGSPDMIDQLGAVAPGRNIALRINPGFGHGHSQKTNTGGPQSKHGIWHEAIDDCLVRADRHGLTVTSMHMHIGSGTDIEHLAQVCGAMEKACETVGRTVQTISAGGGLPVPYREDQAYVDIEEYFGLWNTTRNRLQDKFGHAIELEIEPGRFLVAESGYLLAEIRAVKEMGENTFYLLDAGFNDLARPILYGAYHPISIAHRGPVSGLQRDVVVGGPLCESGDIFTQEEGGFVSRRTLPVATVGDIVVLEVAGAYCFAMASNYNSKYRCPEVLLENGEAKVIRRRETASDLMGLETIPE
ncbi:diaminopimelate decarboxylase [Aureliella helgolandensis]|uniref:Diaminopimelate decarboxylase n=1 Tax=Aureliella helgolandensis TaxID=2527968 RepID=A0A518G5F2_9BACT|nr:diaminopimelate decarboxylase [Aureliella helgolandensis]QDV23823.1 Diaminopimelate decarboxylase [Aureliella helgolandensis]